MRGLKDLRVVDHASGIAGPYCSKLFADGGADVIKLEAPGGDALRRALATRGGGLGVEVTTPGGLAATSSPEDPIAPADPFVTWTEDNGIAGASFDGDENGDGVANGLQWALGLDASTAPFSALLQPVGDTGATVDFTVTLPAGGSAAEISVLVSDDPETNPFAPLTSGSVSTGNPIPAGTTSTVTISLPKNAMGFVQLSVSAPGN